MAVPEFTIKHQVVRVKAPDLGLNISDQTQGAFFIHSKRAPGALARLVY